MPHIDANSKHHILLEYSADDHTRSFAALARRHAIKGGASVVKRWHDRWDGSPHSLEEKARPGRPRLLSRAQVTRHIAAPIRNRNRSGVRARYTELLPQVQAATGRQISLRTLQQYGHDDLEVRKTRGKKRTTEECAYAHTWEMYAAAVVVEPQLTNVDCFSVSTLSVGGDV